MNRIKLLAVDIDNTLLHGSWCGRVPEILQKAVADCVNAGVSFCLASGRPLSMIEDVVNNVGAEAYSIANNGAQVMKGKEVIFEAPLPRELVKEITGVAFRNNIHTLMLSADILLVCELDCKVSAFHNTPYRKQTALFSREEADRVIAETSLLSATLMCNTVEQYERCKSELACLEGLLDMSKSFHNCLTLTQKDINKGRGIIELSKYLGIGLENVMTVGDEENDIPMLEIAGVGCAVANAGEDVKKIADMILPGVEDFGVAYAINEMILKNRIQ